MRTQNISALSIGKTLFFALLSVCLTACGSYQAVTYDDDGIYSTGNTQQPQPHVAQINTTTTNQNSVIDSDEGYFSKKLKEYKEQDNDNVVFTDVDNYSSQNYTDSGSYQNRQNREATPGWGADYAQGANTNVIINSGWGFNQQAFWNPGFGYYNGFNGFGPFYNNYYHPFGGFYNNFYGGGFYGNRFYNNGFNNGFYGYNRPYYYANSRSRRNTRTYNPRGTTSNLSARTTSARNANQRTYSPRSNSTNRTYTPRTTSSSARTYTPKSTSSSNRTYSPKSNSSSNRSYTPRSGSRSSSGTRSSGSRSSGRSYRRR